MMKRDLTLAEKILIARVAEKLDPAASTQLLSDMEKASAEALTDDGSRVVFDIRGYRRPSYEGQHPYGVEMRVLDDDGTEITVLLHADQNNRLYELELIRWSDGRIVNPRWETLKLW